MREIIFDLEADSLHNPTTIHCIGYCDVSSGVRAQLVGADILEWPSIAKGRTLVGHHILGYDLPVLRKILGYEHRSEVRDTLVLSKMYDYSIKDGHSLRAWGERLGCFKGAFNGPWDVCTSDMLEYNLQDIEVNLRMWKFLCSKLNMNSQSVQLEHDFHKLCLDMHHTGFHYDKERADDYRATLVGEVAILDRAISEAYPPQIITGRTSKTGRKLKDQVIEFNPNSVQQVIDKCWDAGWKPTDKTVGHLEFLKEEPPSDDDYNVWHEFNNKANRYETYGWKVNEHNLSTLPTDAPVGLQSILKRMVLESRVRKLDEWSKAYDENTHRIHGTFQGIGTWTHRLSHSNPNMANISAQKTIKYRTEELNRLATDWGGKFRQLWQAAPGYKLVGTDAEGIQLRIFAHFIEDDEFTFAVTAGNKEDATDPHSVNMRRLGHGATRDTAKTFIYAFLLGAGNTKIGEILGVSSSKGGAIKESFVRSYPALARLKGKDIPRDAKAGGFYAIDGRFVPCNSEHLMMAGYLQTNEAIIMKTAAVLTVRQLEKMKINAHLINVVHDELIFEVEDRFNWPERVRLISEDAIKEAGEIYKLKCPLKGQGAVGDNWLETH